VQVWSEIRDLASRIKAAEAIQELAPTSAGGLISPDAGVDEFWRRRRRRLKAPLAGPGRPSKFATAMRSVGSLSLRYVTDFLSEDIRFKVLTCR
jgi:hypothetical protein